jgi:PLP dependent protein
MTIPPLPREPEDSRPYYKEMRKLLDDARRCGHGPDLAELSMGMSGDFEVGIEEGATIVRVGTAIFGSRA